MRIKTLLLSVFAGILCFLSFGPFSGQYRAGARTYPRSEAAPLSPETEIGPRLSQDYLVFNGVWFDGELPQNSVVAYTADKGQAIGATSESLFPDGSPSTFVIRVNAYYDRDLREADMTLLHEMCHVSVAIHGDEYEQHGPRWQSCMLNLAKAGAFRDLW